MRHLGGLLIWAIVFGAAGIHYFAGASLHSDLEELYSESSSESRPIPPAPGALESSARLAPDEDGVEIARFEREVPLLLSYDTERDEPPSMARAKAARSTSRSNAPSAALDGQRKNTRRQ